ncbi:solute carrier family 66 member 2 [Hetaerina americana]|uniref:solute carrier family 66 member 2 n=1 Tax=Hetaerina americana TaxID=62018 RepID=UPI003A7F42D4
MDTEEEEARSSLEINFSNLFLWGCMIAIVFGGVFPYIPQFQKIKKTQSTEGFSLYVCLALIVANTLRIIFWFAKSYEFPLLLQSIIMNFAMFVMVHLCVKVQEKSMVIKGKERVFTDFDWKYFWAWSDFQSYVDCVLVLAIIVGMLTYFMLDISIYVEGLGFLAVLTEAMLGVPQLYRNFISKSTKGMSVKMVLMWTMGDIFKTFYFLERNSPRQFAVCGALQVWVDFCILIQVVTYGTPHRRGRKVQASL